MMVTLLIVLGEIALVLLIVLGAVVWKNLRKRSGERAAVNTLVKSINDNQSARAEKLAGRLKDSAQLDDADALAKANELIKKQNRFYQDAIDLYFSRNNEVLSKLDHRLEDLMDQYQVLVSPGEDARKDENPVAPAISNEALERLSKDIAALTKDVEGLRSENADLHRQLKAAEQELDHLGREYVSAFNKDKNPEGDEHEAAPAESAELVEQEAAPVMDETLLDQASIDSLEFSAAAGGEQDGWGAAERDDDASVSAADSRPAPPADEEDEQPQDQGLLADLDLSELVGEDDAPKPPEDKAASKG